MKRAIVILLVIVAIGAGAGAYYMRRGGEEPTVNTAVVSRGDIVDTVAATGTLQAVTTVQVGSQVSGNIAWLGADFNSIVKKGQEIARLDPSLLEAQLNQTKANLTQSRASLTRAQSDLERIKVQLVDAQQKLTRAKELSARSLLPTSELDTAKVNVDSAQAQLQSQQASVVQAQAAVTQSEASVSQSQVNLDHSVITAPIDGIVTQRSVDVGQTVAASLQSPILFIIAADLTKMQVSANIDESDVGRIRPNQNVTFRVDAYPGEEFAGMVAQIRLQPVVVQNVTTYGTIINVPNPELKLKPGMTANLRVQIARRSDVLRVPNAAIRFRPTTDMFAALNQEVPAEAQFGGGGRGGRGQGGRDGQPGAATPATSQTPTPAPAAPGTADQATRRGESRSGPAEPAQPGAASGDERRQFGGGGDGGGRRDGFGGGFGGGRGGREGSGGREGFGGRGGDQAGRAGGGDRRATMQERMKSMSPDEQKQFLARMKERGQDVSELEKALTPRPATAAKDNAGAAAAQTIDALFAPLQAIESRGRVWLFINKELKSVNLRLGITDGTVTELLSGELEPGMELVTGIVIGSARQTGAAGAQGNPLLPQQGGRGRDGGFGGGGGGNRGGR